jgi:holo-[acyl-carrier protein] synthase
VDLPRFRALLEADGSFRERVFTTAEIRSVADRGDAVAALAARFAAKEAALKALGVAEPSGGDWREIEVERRPGEPPVLHLHGRMAVLGSRLGARRLHVSMSHAGESALAQVVIEGGPPET